MKKLFGCITFAACTISSLSTTAVQAVEVRTTADGISYVSGGVGQAERAQLHAARTQYDLWVTTVARGSGAYLADARLEVQDTLRNRPVLTDDMAGPWLFAALPRGQYRVKATLKLDSGVIETRTKNVAIEPGVTRQVVLRFHSDANVSPQRTEQFGGNPFVADRP